MQKNDSTRKFIIRKVSEKILISSTLCYIFMANANKINCFIKDDHFQFQSMSVFIEIIFSVFFQLDVDTDKQLNRCQCNTFFISLMNYLIKIWTVKGWT